MGEQRGTYQGGMRSTYQVWDEMGIYRGVKGTYRVGQSQNIPSLAIICNVGADEVNTLSLTPLCKLGADVVNTLSFASHDKGADVVNTHSFPPDKGGKGG